MEGSVMGPFALCEGAVVIIAKYMSYNCWATFRIGGEVNNSVISAYSNKKGMMVFRKSVMGEWCNIGADSNNSNLKNNYEEVKLWSYETEGLPKLVSVLWFDDGDHSKWNQYHV
jgi:NDP-sugar pyrophosphorylase family protein